MAGRISAARSATIASTQTISTNVNPASRFVTRLLLRLRLGHALDLGGIARAAGLSAGAERGDLIRRAFGRRAVDIGVSPRIGGNRSALDIGTVPGRRDGGALHQRGEPLRRRGITPGVRIVKNQPPRK